MENTNEMKIIFDSRPENEGLARVAAAAFCTQVDMFTTVFIGNSQTKEINNKMVTPRGYRNV